MRALAYALISCQNICKCYHKRESDVVVRGEQVLVSGASALSALVFILSDWSKVGGCQDDARI